MMEIAFSGIENSKLFKGAHPQKIPRKNGTKSPLLIHLVTLFNLLATSIFQQHCQKKSMHIDISINWLKSVCHLIHLLGFSPASSWQHDKSLAWEIHMLLVVEVLEQP